MQEFNFQLLVPINRMLIKDPNNQYSASNDFLRLEKIIKSVDIIVDAAELGIEPVKVSLDYCGGADNSDLPLILKSYFNQKENFVYDMDGIRLLQKEFNCASPYESLVFSCKFQITDEFIEEYEKTIDGDGLDPNERDLWSYDSFTQKDFDITITFQASEIFSNLFFSTIVKLIVLLNFAMPSCLAVNCVFLNYTYISEDLSSTIPYITTFKLTEFLDYQFAFKDISFKAVWEWADKLSILSSNNYINTNVSRALNHYFLLFNERITIRESLLAMVAGLEALFVMPYEVVVGPKTKLSKVKQLVKNIANLIDVFKLFPNQNFEAIIIEIYDQRSRIVHGDKAPIDAFIKHSRSDEQILQANRKAVLILLTSLRKICELNIIELPYEMFVTSLVET